MSSKSGPPVQQTNPPPVPWHLLSYHHSLHCGQKILIGSRFVQNYRTGHIRELAVNASGAIVVKVSIQGGRDKANILAQLGTDGEGWGGVGSIHGKGRVKRSKRACVQVRRTDSTWEAASVIRLATADKPLTSTHMGTFDCPYHCRAAAASSGQVELGTIHLQPPVSQWEL